MQLEHDEKIEFPAEWAPQSGILLVWPHASSDWKENIGEIETTYIAICKAVTPYQKILIICYDQTHQDHIEKILNTHSIENDAYILAICKTNDTWCRDYGPLCTRHDGNHRLNNFIFNAWGNKYSSNLDNALSKYLSNEGLFGSTQLVDYDFILEGGSIDSNGHGTALTTTHCLLKRHPDKSKTDIENSLKKHLGIKIVHWLDHGSLSGDDTDAHVDNLARFVNKNTILYCACDDKDHPDYNSLQKMEVQLKALKQENGDAYKLIPIYIPKLIEANNQALPASYINFLIINDAVLVPVFCDPQDKTALEIFSQCFPKRSIIGINSNTLIKQFGGLHCATMNLAAGVIQ